MTPLERAPKHLTVAEFATFDDGTDTRYELVAGELRMMNPPRVRHVQVTVNLYNALRDRLRGKPCQPYFGAGVALADDADTWRVPDVFVACDPGRDYYFDSPHVIFEVLSPSTEREDRSDKLDFYRSFPSVTAIVLVWQDTRRVELHARESEGWRVQNIIGTGVVALPSLGVELNLDEIYMG